MRSPSLPRRSGSRAPPQLVARYDAVVHRGEIVERLVVGGDEDPAGGTRRRGDLEVMCCAGRPECRLWARRLAWCRAISRSNAMMSKVAKMASTASSRVA